MQIIISSPALMISWLPVDMLLCRIHQIFCDVLMESGDQNGISLGVSAIHRILEYCKINGIISDVSYLTAVLPPFPSETGEFVSVL
jgi:hypothetical protein